MSSETRDRGVGVSDSSRNVCADLRRPDADERRLRVGLAIAINHAIEACGLRQAEAARVIGATQPEVSALANLKLAGFSVGRLMGFLTALNRDVEIAIRPSPTHGHVRVCESTDASGRPWCANRDPWLRQSLEREYRASFSRLLDD